jgi:outer membrane protein W
VGADFGWAVYKQCIPTTTYNFGTQSVTTDLYDYAYNYSLSVNLDYYFLPMEKMIAPYAGLGIGVAYDKFAQYYNIYGTKGTSWGFLVRPEAGVLIGFKENSSWRIKAAAHYDYSTNTSTDFDYKNFMSIGFQVGLVKMAW